MAKSNVYTVKLKRRLLGKTDYRKRLKLLITHKPRVVVRKSLNHISAQVVSYDKKGDKVMESANSRELKSFGWKLAGGNVPSAYLVGMLIGKKAKKKGINELILDIGLHKSVKGSRIYALVKGAVEAGINVHHSQDILPDKDRVEGKHIEKYATMLKKNDEKFKKAFAVYIKNNVDPTKLSQYVAEARKAILGDKSG